MDSSSQTQSTQSTQSTQQQSKVGINPLQLLVNATFLAYQRGAYNMKEASLISQAIDFFVETKQAEVPQMNQSQQQPQTQQSPHTMPQQQQSSRPETIPEEPEKVIFTSQ
jgi:hypothetical protein